MPETCDHCSRLATHDDLTEGGRARSCCSHHIALGGTPYVGHSECLAVGAVLSGMSVVEFTALVKASEIAGKAGFFG